MFGLWYLSLAISEIKKHFGWTSLFDVFKTNKTGNVKAIENNGPSSSTTQNDVPTPKLPQVNKEEPPKKTPVTVPPKPDTQKTVTVKPQPVLPQADKTPKVPDLVPPKTEPKKNDVSLPQPPAPKKEETNKPSVTIPSKPVELPKPKEVTPPSPKTDNFKLPEMKQPELPKVPINKPEPAKQEPPKVDKMPSPSNPEPQLPKLSTPLKVEDHKLPSPSNPAVVFDWNSTPKATPELPSARNLRQAPDPRMFGGAAPETNGFDAHKPKSNLRDATTSFLQEEGKDSGPRQTQPNMQRNKSDTMVDAAVLKKLEDGFAKLAASDSKSLLKKYLTKEVFDNLKNKKTPTFGSTLLDCVQSGFENHDSGVGIYAPDAEAYSVFAELFDPIIEDYHKGFKKTDKHPARDFGDVSVFKNLDPNNEFVVSTRVRCGRSLEGYPFNPCLTEAQYKEMEQKVSSTLQGLEGELKGKFYPLTGMDKAVQQQLIDDHFLFKEGDRFLQAANACRYWPSGRGIYHNDNKTFLVWCNEEDHLRIISMQMGGDLGQVYARLVTAVNEIEKRLPFSHHDRLGFLTFCPTNLGTTIRASVHIKVPKLAANKAKLEEVAAKYNLQVRGTRGEHTEAEGGVYDISNKRRMGLTEYQAVKEMYDGINELIKIEKSL